MSATALAAPSSAQIAVDGDTAKVNGQTVRLWGIDSPETRQWCGGYPAGREATKALSALIRGRAVACEHRVWDRYNRSVSLCRADGLDLGAAMVRSGHALAFVKYSKDYVHLEEEARRERIGVHAHSCQAPWDWRAERR